MSKEDNVSFHPLLSEGLQVLQSQHISEEK